jgi:hypothetical protein
MSTEENKNDKITPESFLVLLKMGSISFIEVKQNLNTDDESKDVKNTEYIYKFTIGSNLQSFENSKWILPFTKSIDNLEDDCDYEYNNIRYYCITLPNNIFQFERIEEIKPVPVLNKSKYNSSLPNNFILTKENEEDMFSRMDLEIAKINNNFQMKSNDLETKSDSNSLKFTLDSKHIVEEECISQE